MRTRLFFNASVKDLEKAQVTITELENDLKAERARLRAMSTEQSRVDRDKEQIFVQLQRTEKVCVPTDITG